MRVFTSSCSNISLVICVVSLLHLLLVCVQARLHRGNHDNHLNYKSINSNNYLQVFESYRDYLLSSLHIFAGGFYGSIAKETANLVYSPLAVHSALSMLLLGSGPNTSARDNLTNKLEFKPYGDSTDWVHEEYRQILQSLFRLEPYGERGITKSNSLRHNWRDKDGHHTRENYSPVSDEQQLDISLVTLSMTKQSYNLDKNFTKSIKKFYNHEVQQIDTEKSSPDDKLEQLQRVLNSLGKRAGFSKQLVQEDDLKLYDHAMNLFVFPVIKTTWSDFKMQSKRGRFNDNSDVKFLGASNIAGKFVQFSEERWSSSKMQSNFDCKRPNPTDPGGLNKLEFAVSQVNLAGNMTLSFIVPLKNDATSHDLYRLETELIVDRNYKQGVLLRRALQVVDGSEERTFNRFEIPSFKIESKYNFHDGFLNFRLGKLTELPGFTQMSADSNIYVQSAMHGAVIDVADQNHRQRSPILSDKQVPNGPESECRSIISNPFMFVLRFKEIPLLMGHFVKPQA